MLEKKILIFCNQFNKKQHLTDVIVMSLINLSSTSDNREYLSIDCKDMCSNMSTASRMQLQFFSLPLLFQNCNCNMFGFQLHFPFLLLCCRACSTGAVHFGTFLENWMVKACSFFAKISKILYGSGVELLLSMPDISGSNPAWDKFLFLRFLEILGLWSRRCCQFPAWWK